MMRGECHRRPLLCFCCLHIPYRKKDRIYESTYFLYNPYSSSPKYPHNQTPSSRINRIYTNIQARKHTHTSSHTPNHILYIHSFYYPHRCDREKQCGENSHPGRSLSWPCNQTVPSAYSPSALDLIAYPAMMKTYGSLERLLVCACTRFYDIHIYSHTHASEYHRRIRTA